MNFFVSRVLQASAALLIIAASPPEARAKTKRIELVSEPCNYLVAFDPKKTEEQRIRDTHDLLQVPTAWSEYFGQAIFSAADLKTLDLVAIDRQCAETLEKVKSLKLVKLAGIEEMRSAVVAEIEDSCRFDRLNAEGYRDPSVLRQYAAASACFRYIDALEGKTDLAAVYGEVSQIACKDNASTKNCLAEAEQKRGNIGEMKLEVHNFGWSNCANGHTIRSTAGNTEKRRKLQKAFLKAMKARKVNCEGP